MTTLSIFREVCAENPSYLIRTSEGEHPDPKVPNEYRIGCMWFELFSNMRDLWTISNDKCEKPLVPYADKKYHAYYYGLLREELRAFHPTKDLIRCWFWMLRRNQRFEEHDVRLFRMYEKFGPEGLKQYMNGQSLSLIPNTLKYKACHYITSDIHAHLFPRDALLPLQNHDDLHHFFDAEFTKLIVRTQIAFNLKVGVNLKQDLESFLFYFSDLNIGKKRRSLLKLIEIIAKEQVGRPHKNLRFGLR